MIKILVYISVPGLILDLIISVAGSMLLDLVIKIALFICILSEGYNVLALHSQYKRITGKSRLVAGNGTTQSLQQFPNNCFNQNEGFRLRTGYNPHCRTCTCYKVYENPPEYSITELNNTQTLETVVNNNNNRPTTTVNNRPTTLQVIDANLAVPTPNTEITHDCLELQIMDTRDTNAIVFNLNVNSSNSYTERPTTLNISDINVNNKAKDTKIELSDDPVIYDERQLVVNTSPVIEDRTLLF